MAIEHSDALLILERNFQALEKQPIDFPILGKPVFVRPITCKQMDLLNTKTGQEYNCRLLQAALIYEDGSPVFYEADVFRMETRADPTLIATTASRVAECIFNSFGPAKENSQSIPSGWLHRVWQRLARK